MQPDNSKIVGSYQYDLANKLPVGSSSSFQPTFDLNGGVNQTATTPTVPLSTPTVAPTTVTTPTNAPATITVDSMGKATPITVPTVGTNQNISTTIGANADASVAMAQQAEQERQNLMKITGNEAEKQRSAMTSAVQNIFGETGKIKAGQAQLEADMGKAQQEEALRNIRTEIANQRIAQRGQLQGVRTQFQTAAQAAASNNAINDEYNYRLANLAIQEAAAQGNVTAIEQSAKAKTDLLLAPYDNALEYYKTWGAANLDALSKKEQAQLEFLTKNIEQQKQNVKELESAKASMIAEVAKNGGGTDRATIERINNAKSLTGIADAGSNYIGKMDFLKTQAEIKKITADAAALNINPTNVNPDNAPLINAFNSAATGLTEGERKQAKSTFSNLVNSGDTEGAKQYLKTVALQTLSGDVKTQTIGRFNAISSLEEIQKLLDQAKAKGTNTNLVSGNIVNIAQKLGTTNDPDLTYISNRIASVLQTYRRSMTGVAFSPAESKQYEKIFPDITDFSKLNTTKIQALLDSLNTNNRSTLELTLGPSNYDKVFGRESNLLPSERVDKTNTPSVSITPQDNSIFNSIVTPQQTNSSGLTPKSPSSPQFNLTSFFK